MTVAGVDEAGRGCLAGPVYAAAVILPPDAVLDGLNDSKKLSATQREKLFPRIQAQAQAWAIAWATVEEIERVNILQATFLAMRRAVEALAIPPVRALVDGNQAPPLACAVETIVDGDALVPSIMAASVLAKVARDREMMRLDAAHPGYGFARHKGYGTAEHLAAIRSRGPCAIHRRTFAPIAQFALEFAAATADSRRP
ncbi:MAG: ribonuclease HII [Gammaproteobacteria bacterium]|nr:ribonuclease HII [Gammaproteobacteria bacterium]